MEYAIDLGLLAIDLDTLEFYTPELTDTVINNIYAPATEKKCISTLRASSHGCGHEVWDVGATVAENYNIIVDYYNDMVSVSIIAPGTVDPWISTASYWVGLVREKGAWDYKSNANYMGKYYCCSYGGKTNQDQYIGWIGNYNYGYTGEFLFNLDMLHLGSFVVAQFDPKDKETDWPAIDEGYYDVP